MVTWDSFRRTLLQQLVPNKTAMSWFSRKTREPAVELDLRLVSASESRSRCGPIDVETLLLEALPTGPSQRLSVAVAAHSRFILWVARASDETSLCFDDLVSRVEDYLRQDRQSPIVLLFRGPKDAHGGLSARTPTYLLAATSFDGAISQSMRFPQDYDGGVQQIEHSLSLKPLMQSSKKKLPLAVLALILLTAVGVLYYHFSTVAKTGWVRYNTNGSFGPRYQLQLTHRNVTEWAETHARNNKEWALRIDDQAMIPAHLWDEEEEHYQQWFRKNFPETEEIRTKELYLKASFLGDPYSIQVRADKSFHTAHCVLALRRYWKAKESGRHVCPRDIDYRHMKHCLDSLDELAFPDRPNAPMDSTGPPTNASVGGRVVLLWKTKVCW